MHPLLIIFTIADMLLGFLFLELGERAWERRDWQIALFCTFLGLIDITVVAFLLSNLYR